LCCRNNKFSFRPMVWTTEMIGNPMLWKDSAVKS